MSYELEATRRHESYVMAVAAVAGRVITGSLPEEYSGGDNVLKFFDAAGRCVHTRRVPNGNIHSLEALPEGMVIAGQQFSLSVWEVNEGRCHMTISTQFLISLAALPGGRVVSSHTDDKLKIWDVSAGHCLHVLDSSYLTCIAVLDNETIVCAGSAIEIWNISEYRHVKSLTGHQKMVTCVAVQDRIIISGSYDRKLKVWSATDGLCLRTIDVFAGVVNYVRCLAILPGHRVCAAFANGELKFYDVTDGRCLQIIRAHSSNITCLKALPNHRVVSGAWDNTIKVFSDRRYRIETKMARSVGRQRACCDIVKIITKFL